MEQLSKSLKELEKVDVESEIPLDKDAVAAKFFRELGFIPNYKSVTSSEVSPVFQTIMVVSKTRNMATEIEVDDETTEAKRITAFVLANQLWEASK
jgi:hypothetical protein